MLPNACCKKKWREKIISSVASFIHDVRNDWRGRGVTDTPQNGKMHWMYELAKLPRQLLAPNQPSKFFFGEIIPSLPMNECAFPPQSQCPVSLTGGIGSVCSFSNSLVFCPSDHAHMSVDRRGLEVVRLLGEISERGSCLFVS